jgi:uncharacterized protein (TIGR00255 family)
MIVSMTGFGDASTQRDGTHYSVEIRSLNNRFFKPVLKLPESLSGLEPELETMLRKELQRGSITYVLKMRLAGAEAAHVLNTEVLAAYLAQIRSVAHLADGATLDLGSVLALPGVCQEPVDESDHLERHGPVVRELTSQAIGKLNAMRRREGEALFEDLVRNARLISDCLDEVRVRAPLVIEEYHKRLLLRVNQLLGKAELQVNQPDLLKEVALFAERADISEELQRLSHHLASFEQTCRSADHAGRKLDFITQEMLREANTIASKANDALIGAKIVEIKGAIDRLKEQVQNVE